MNIKFYIIEKFADPKILMGHPLPNISLDTEKSLSMLTTCNRSYMTSQNVVVYMEECMILKKYNKLPPLTGSAVYPATFWLFAVGWWALSPVGRSLCVDHDIGIEGS